MSLQKLPLSIIVLTFNEEGNVGPCLETIVHWAQEVFVVDSGSTDRTLDIVSTYGAKVLTHPFQNYSHQRNWAQNNVPLSHEWVFHIDADERVSPELVDKLRELFSERSHAAQDYAGFMVRRKIIFFGKPMIHGGLYPTYHCRIFRRQSGRCEDREYDQHFLVDGRTSLIEADLLELTATSLFSWTARHNKWAQMEARELKGHGRDASVAVQGKLHGSPIERRRWLRSSLYAKTPMFFRAFLYFITRYLFRGGFLDGTPGLIYHVLQGFWFRFYVDACCYELQRLERGSLVVDNDSSTIHK
ncbi:MAG: glycosyltransferase family 2 protein [Nitrospira sp.]|nr:glycosyltransferase family 2 protein [Nitrospira sp.]